MLTQETAVSIGNIFSFDPNKKVKIARDESGVYFITFKGSKMPLQLSKTILQKDDSAVKIFTATSEAKNRKILNAIVTIKETKKGYEILNREII